MKPTKRVSKATITRRQEITNEIYSILHTEAHKWMSFLQVREDNVTIRLNALEKAGAPQHTMDEIKLLLSRLEYGQRRLIKANEGLLAFFNVTKDFLTDPKQDNEK